MLFCLFPWSLLCIIDEWWRHQGFETFFSKLTHIMIAHCTHAHNVVHYTRASLVLLLLMTTPKYKKFKEILAYFGIKILMSDLLYGSYVREETKILEDEFQGRVLHFQQISAP